MKKAPALPFLAAALALTAAALPASPAAAQSAAPLPTIEAGHSLLTVNAQGKSTRSPDLAVFSAGVTTQAQTASAALGDNSRSMSGVVTALKRQGIAARDIQTSNLSLSPVYAPPKRQPDGSFEDSRQIIGYQASNTVTVRQRKLEDFGKVIDTLVAAGANQVNGPSFAIDEPAAALDEARADAIKTARQRAELYARAAGLRVARILSISESGGYSPPSPVMYRRMASAEAAPPPPVEAGELELTADIAVQFELAP